MSAVPATASAADSLPRLRRMFDKPHLPLLLTALALVAVGLVMILSASSIQAYSEHGTSFSYFKRQMVGFGLGLAAMAVMARSDYRKLKPLARPLLTFNILLLVAVILPGIGSTRGGSSRWIIVGPVSIQPSEIAKLTLVLFVASILEAKGSRIRDAREFAVPVLPMTGLVALLVIAQPDLGTTIILGGGVVVVLFLAGARLPHMGLLTLGGLVSVVILSLTRSYRRERVFSFLNPWADPWDTGYQVIQGQIAMGSGGFFGLGLGASRQKWSYVPNAHTDFIYAIIGEELGLAGTLTVLGLIVLLLYLGIRIARQSPDRFGMLLAGGITGVIGLQALINMGSISGMLPITGVPLPLISFGSSSLVLTMASIGILLSIAKRGRRVKPKPKLPASQPKATVDG
ncbi:MAG TPA: putative lipid II flippase FtsW [Actinomycetota bacterium]|nr:putative lipid II flippase FtsW [Actinomycetota bacterium]